MTDPMELMIVDKALYDMGCLDVGHHRLNLARAAIAALDRHRAEVGPTVTETAALARAESESLGDPYAAGLRAYLKAKAAQHDAPRGEERDDGRD